MSFTKNDKENFIQQIIGNHDNYWSDKRAEMLRYKNIYAGRYFDNLDGKSDDQLQTKIETADAYNYIEAFMSGLFSKDPSILVEKDLEGLGDSDLVRVIGNKFLQEHRQMLENCSRMALLYPCAFVKLFPTASDIATERTTITAVSPWDMILDRDAVAWDQQQYVGHVYWERVSWMNKQFGKRDWAPAEKQDYFIHEDRHDDVRSAMPTQFQYCKVIEVYDLVNDRVYQWTRDHKTGPVLLSDERIPLRDKDDKPVVPIVQLVFCKEPDRPLDGLSTMSRGYDQFREKNNLRGFWADAIRRDTRQYLFDKESFSEEDLAGITSGEDGALIGVETNKPLNSLISVVPSVNLNSDHSRYLSAIEQDIDRASMMAPFSRGQSTGVTATEISVQSQYTASAIGKYARQRDAFFEEIVQIYVLSTALLLEEKEKDFVVVDSVPKSLTEESLSGRFKIIALDQASTPISDAIKRQQITEAIPVLSALGVDMAAVREEYVRLMGFPQSFLEVAPEPEPEPQPAQQPQQPQQLLPEGQLA